MMGNGNSFLLMGLYAVDGAAAEDELPPGCCCGCDMDEAVEWVGDDDGESVTV
jgi:hypothetical protein